MHKCTRHSVSVLELDVWNLYLNGWNIRVARAALTENKFTHTHTCTSPTVPIGCIGFVVGMWQILFIDSALSPCEKIVTRENKTKRRNGKPNGNKFQLVCRAHLTRIRLCMFAFGVPESHNADKMQICVFVYGSCIVYVARFVRPTLDLTDLIKSHQFDDESLDRSCDECIHWFIVVDGEKWKCGSDGGGDDDDDCERIGSTSHRWRSINSFASSDERVYRKPSEHTSRRAIKSRHSHSPSRKYLFCKRIRALNSSLPCVCRERESANCLH